jgi:hypothetical protein
METNVNKNENSIQLMDTWYQSYYLWTKLVLANQQQQHQQQQLTTTTTTAGTNSQPNQNNNSQNQQPINQTVTVYYKVPSLMRRFVAELCDAFYVQCLKIVISLLIFNYTSIM